MDESSQSSSLGPNNAGENIHFPMTMEESYHSSSDHLDLDIHDRTESTAEEYASTSASYLQQHSYLPGTQHPIYPPQFLKRDVINHSVEARASSSHPTSIDDHIGVGTSASSETIQVPILQMDVVLFPNSTLPLRITNPSFCEYLRREIDNARSIRHTTDRDMQVRIGVILRRKERRRAAYQMTRQDDSRNISGNDDEMEDQQRRSRMGRWNMALIRRNFESANNDEEESSTSSSEYHHESSGQPRNPEERSLNYGRDLPRDRCVGRIGTFATLTSVRLEEVSPQGNQNRASSEIIATALTTGRFEIISPIEDDLPANFEWRVYNVREINDPVVPTPSIFRRPRPSKNTKEVESEVYLARNAQAIVDISKRSSLPPWSLQLIWPVKLIEDIIAELKLSTVYAGLESSLPDFREQMQGNFSFWLASNLPLSHSEKLDLLESFSDVERLRLLLSMIRKRNSFVRCKQCRANIANINSVFSLNSAAGTSGAYVNEYGVVHHTTTIKQIIDGAIVCHGNAETRDSWFPGYSWTIAYCSACYNHLGWKFDGVTTGLQTEQFWGLSGSQIV